MREKGRGIFSSPFISLYFNYMRRNFYYYKHETHLFTDQLADLSSGWHLLFRYH